MTRILVASGAVLLALVLALPGAARAEEDDVEIEEITGEESSVESLPEPAPAPDAAPAAPPAAEPPPAEAAPAPVPPTRRVLVPARREWRCRTVVVPAVTRVRCVPVWEDVEVPCRRLRCVPRYRTAPDGRRVVCGHRYEVVEEGTVIRRRFAGWRSERVVVRPERRRAVWECVFVPAHYVAAP